MKLVFLFSLLSCSLLHATTFTEMEFDQAALQAKVEAKFPIVKEVTRNSKKTYADGEVKKSTYGHITLTQPKVILKEGVDRITIQIHFVFEPLLISHPVQGDVVASGVLRYDVATSSFFIDQGTVDQLRINHLFVFLDDKLEAYINRRLPDYLKERAFYKLEGNAAKAAGRQLLQEVRVRDGKLIAKLGIGDASPEVPHTPANAVPTQDPGIDMWSSYGP